MLPIWYARSRKGANDSYFLSANRLAMGEYHAMSQFCFFSHILIKSCLDQHFQFHHYQFIFFVPLLFSMEPIKPIANKPHVLNSTYRNKAFLVSTYLCQVDGFF